MFVSENELKEVGTVLKEEETLVTTGVSKVETKENGRMHVVNVCKGHLDPQTKYEVHVKDAEGKAFKAMLQFGLSSYFDPSQLHLGWRLEDENCWVVTWSTRENYLHTFVEARSQVEATWKSFEGSIKRFVSGPSATVSNLQYIHRVALCQLNHSTTYHYRLKATNLLGYNEYYEEEALKFKTLSEYPLGYQVMIFGDLGDQNQQIMDPLKDTVERHNFAFILHNGDFAYDLHSNSGKVGDDFMNSIQPIASSIPYLTTPGNHEHQDEFYQYKFRFAQTISKNPHAKLWYSFDLGPVHYIALSSEVYFFEQQHLKEQYDWLIQDLTEAQKNRKKHPWIVTFAHRPLYCSNLGIDDCSKPFNVIRDGVLQTDGSRKYGLEDVLKYYQVDLAFWAHKHSYERMLPMYKGEVVGTSVGDTFRNAKAPIYITSGSAGCKEIPGTFREEKPRYTAFRARDYGFGVLHVFNNTHLLWKQYSVEKSKFIDSIVVCKNAIL